MQFRVPVIEKFGWQPPVISIRNDPPGSPVKGDRYIVGVNPSGNWVGQTNKIASWLFVPDFGLEWWFDTPEEGWICRVASDGSYYLYSGGAWLKDGHLPKYFGNKTYFFIPRFLTQASVGTSFGSANQIRVLRFYVDIKIIVSSVHFRISSGASSRYAGLGIYDNNGNILFQTGAISTTSGIKSVNLSSPVEIGPGFFIYAVTCNGTGVTFTAFDTVQNQNDILNAGSRVHFGLSTETGLNGVLPISISPEGWTASTYTGIVACKLQG